MPPGGKRQKPSGDQGGQPANQDLQKRAKVGSPIQPPVVQKREPQQPSSRGEGKRRRSTRTPVLRTHFGFPVDQDMTYQEKVMQQAKRERPESGREHGDTSALRSYHAKKIKGGGNTQAKLKNTELQHILPASTLFSHNKNSDPKPAKGKYASNTDSEIALNDPLNSIVLRANKRSKVSDIPTKTQEYMQSQYPEDKRGNLFNNVGPVHQEKMFHPDYSALAKKIIPSAQNLTNINKQDHPDNKRGLYVAMSALREGHFISGLKSTDEMAKPENKAIVFNKMMNMARASRAVDKWKAATDRVKTKRKR